MVDTPQVLDKVVLAREALLTDTIAAFKGTIQLEAVRATVDRDVMAAEARSVLKFR